MEENRTSIVDLETGKSDTTEMDGKYLTFWVEDQLFGIPIADVVQIVGMQGITSVPEFPYYAKGIINLRGSIIPIIDIRLRFDKEEIPYNERTCIILTSMRGSTIGVIVDSVNEVANIPDESISAPPKLSQGSESAYLTGIGRHDEKVVLLLDTHKILSGDQLDSLEDFQM